MSTASKYSIITPAVRCFTFVEEFEDRGGHFDILKGYEHEPKRVDSFVREQPDGTWIGLDVRGAVYFGYSYAKQTVLAPLQEQLAGKYGKRRLLVIGVAPTDDSHFFEGIQEALEKDKIPAFLAASPDTPFRDWEVIGTLAEHLRRTLDISKGVDEPKTTAAFAAMIGQSLPNTNNRLRDLRKVGLIQRERIISPTGGYEWVNSVI